MATKKQQGDRVGALVADVEALAKRLRTDIRKRAEAAGLLKNLRAMADQLRKRAATAAAQVEKYVHEIRKDLEAAGKSAKPAKRKKAKPKARKPMAAPPSVAL
jgi:CRISPR/Cas system-associated protein Cas10 (large subunit of type III CRISPR-Cas system)